MQRFFLIVLIYTKSMGLFSSINDSMLDKPVIHSFTIGIANQKYVADGWLPGVFGNIQTETSSLMPAVSLHYDIEKKLGNNWGLQSGLSATFAQFRINNSNFVTPNILNGYINRKVLHQYMSMPIHAFWQVPIALNSYLQIYGGMESMYKLRFEQKGEEFASLYRNDGSSINSYGFSAIYIGERMSWFRVFNFGMKFRFNTKEKNRIAIGLNYNFMRSYSPLEVRTNFNIANANFYTENYIFFSGLRLNLGYYW
jgi:hypothetical protein